MPREETPASSIEEAKIKLIKDEGGQYYVARRVRQARASGYRDVTYWLECGHIKHIQELLLLGDTAQSIVARSQQDHPRMRCYECGKAEQEARREQREAKKQQKQLDQ
jgi:hypothetical protein